MLLDWKEYEQTARQMAAEGCVLLKNDADALPLVGKQKVAVFGRIQRHYYKSGTGSGGMVNVHRVVGILDALLEEKDLSVDRELLYVYDQWEETNLFNEGIGWANEPWSQEEMPVTEQLVKACSDRNDAAIVIIGRTAGEDKDNVDEKGAYRLSDLEVDLIEKVTKHFSRTILLLNVGSIMDMTADCVSKCQAILYCWQGGMVGGYGVADILTGRVNPSGRLTDTIAYQIEDYPSTANFGDPVRNFYKEDIYVGYRYFETVAKEKVLYPFGYGLSYTSFEQELVSFSEEDGEITVTVKVKNTGKTAGKQVVQAYMEAPQGGLGKPSRVLAGFEKTKLLSPGKSEKVTIRISPYTYASYDDMGASGNRYCYVLEKGVYTLYVGENVRAAESVGSFKIPETRVLEQLSGQMAPVIAYKRMRPVFKPEEAVRMCEQAVPTEEEEEQEKRNENLPEEIPYTGDLGYQLQDVAEERVSMEAFVAQFTDDDLSCIIRGEGMGSPKVTPGTAAAYGGVSAHLDAMGIPCGCCSDGPSGMRIDCGMKVFSLPNGTLIACSFNLPLVEKLFTMLGKEMISNKIDNILGPGMNIHRNPLNGRNFEYFSEDPYLTGKMAAAQLKGLHSVGVTGTIKHFAGNNQETKRLEVDSVVSERALREIYLKGFEIAVREGGADSVMTTYGQLNGVWTAGRYELNTAILRNEWGFQGIVMTDWWAKISRQGAPKDARQNDFAQMVRAQNDLYMVCPQANQNMTEDNTLAELASGELTRGELQRSAMNICRQLMHMPAYFRKIGQPIEVEILNRPVTEDDFDMDSIVYYDVKESAVISLDGVDTAKGSNYVFALAPEHLGIYEMTFTYSSELGEVAQIPVTIFTQSVPVGVLTFNGTNGEWKAMKRRVCISNKYVIIRLHFAQSGVVLKELTFNLLEQGGDADALEGTSGEFDIRFT